MNSDNGADGNLSDETNENSRVLSLREALDELSASQSGLRFVYSALALLAQRFDLRDVVVVLESESVGTQIFCLGGKAVNRDIAGQLGRVPGVYCDPAVVSAADLEEVMSACKRALVRHRTRPREAQQPLDHRGVRPFDARPPRSSPVRHGPDLRHALARSRGPFRSGGERANTRRSISRLLVVVDLVTFVMTVSDIHGPLRYVFGLVLGIVIPGWSVIGLLKLGDGALELGLTMATSLALVMIAAQILMAVHLWHPIVLEEFTCLVCLPSLLSQSGSRLGRPIRAK